MERESNPDYIFKAFVVNTAAYDAGDREASGAWLHFPPHAGEVEAVMEQIGLPDGGSYFMDDYVSQVEGLKPILPMYGDIADLSKLAQGIADLSPDDRELLAAVQDSPHRLTTLEQFKEFPQNTEFFVLEQNINRTEDLGWRYLAQHMDVLLPKELLDAVDPVPFGRHAMAEDRGCFTKHGYLTLSGDDWQHERPPEKQAEKKPSIRERLEQNKKECAKQGKVQPHRGKTAPEL